MRKLLTAAVPPPDESPMPEPADTETSEPDTAMEPAEEGPDDY